MKAIRKKKSFEQIRLEALKYVNRGEFATKSNSFYQAARKSGLLEDVCSHMDPPLTKAHTLEEIQLEANKYTRRSEFEKKSPGYYQAACKRPDYQKVVAHMSPPMTEAYSLEEIRQEACKYQNRASFKKHSSSIYNAACKRPDFEDICSHMALPLNTPYTTEEIKEIVSSCKTKRELYEKYPSVYGIALKWKNKENLTLPMPDPVNQSGINNSMYGKTGKQSPSFKWTDHKIKEEVANYTKRTALATGNQTVYKIAKKREDYEQLVAHMVQGHSVPESEILDVIKTTYPKAQKFMDRKALFPDKPHIHGFEIDIYIPELRKGIEFDGKYHHSFDGLKRGRPNWPDEDIKNYHQLKDAHFAIKGIKLLHIKEEEWNNNKEACIKRCLDFLSSE